MTCAADAYLFRPANVEEIREVLALARSERRQVVLRGAGRSYGDAAIGAECVAIDLSRMHSILSWDKATGVIEVEAGTTIEDLWRHVLEDGYWLPVVSGTMFPMIGGALAMNIHGKNAFHAGPIGDHVEEITLLTASGELLTLSPSDGRFRAVIGGAGLLGIVVRAKIRMKKIACGDLRVLSLSARNWDEEFEIFERYADESDYLVGWVDCFGRGASAGRGQIHVAWYATEPSPTSLSADHQDLPATIMGIVPKSAVWRFLKVLNTRTGMRFVNWARYHSSRILGAGKTVRQSIVAFQFLLDYVPNWRWAYRPGGFIQFQSFVPKERAREVFARQIELQREAHLESFLAVMKRHRPDGFLLSHAVDGYSLALDFKVTRRNRERLWELAHAMAQTALDAGGRFYFAKDSTLRPEDARRYLGQETLAKFRAIKCELDPEGLFTSGLAQRLDLF
jgi:decaprenylphospho-beta-D-ribofuranose 2-oxidase